MREGIKEKTAGINSDEFWFVFKNTIKVKKTNKRNIKIQTLHL